MRSRMILGAMLAGSAIFLGVRAASSLAAGEQKQAVYVGVRRLCHRATTASTWATSSRRWYLSEARQGLHQSWPQPEARQIASSAAFPWNRRNRRCAWAATPPRPRPRNGKRTLRSSSATACSARSATARAASTSTAKRGRQTLGRRTRRGLKMPTQRRLPEVPQGKRLAHARAQEAGRSTSPRPCRRSPTPPPKNSASPWHFKSRSRSRIPTPRASTPA